MNFVIKTWGPVETSTVLLRDFMKFPGKPIAGCRCVFRVDGFCYVGLIFPSSNALP